MTDAVSNVCNPAQMMLFDSIDAFKLHINNFYLMFVRIGEPVPDIYRSRPAFHRFAARYPQRVAELEELLESDGRSPGEHSWARLLEAYQLMSQLVDVTDEGVIPPPHLPYPEIDPRTGIDSLYLTR